MKKVEIKLPNNGPLRLSIDSEKELINNVLFDSNGKSIEIKKIQSFADVANPSNNLFAMEYTRCVILTHQTL